MTALVARALRAFFGGALLILLHAAALLLSWSKLGRLLRTVSIPRMQMHLSRTVLTILGLAAGVAALLAVLLINRSIMSGARATVEEIAGKADLQITGGTSGFDEAILEQVRAAGGVAHATRVVQQMVAVHGDKSTGERLLVLGVDLLDDGHRQFAGYSFKELDAILEDPLPFMNATDRLILGRKAAERLGYKLHDTIPLLTSSGVQRFEIWGLLDDVGFGRALGGAVALMYQPAMQVTFDRGTNIDRIDVFLEEGSSASRVAKTLKAELGTHGLTIAAPAQKTQELADLLVGLRRGLALASMIALIVGAFLVQNTMAISIVQRRREFGTIRALGATRRQVVSLLLLEGLLVGIVGSAVGVGASIGLAHALLNVVTRTLSESVAELSLAELQLDPQLILGAFIAGVVATIVATALPAWRAGRVVPDANLRAGGIRSDGAHAALPNRADLVGLALLLASFICPWLPVLGEHAALGFVMIGTGLLGTVLLLPRFLQATNLVAGSLGRGRLGAAVRLAKDNLTRDLLRTSRTAAALTASTGMIVSIGVFVASFDESMTRWLESATQGDLFVTSGARTSGLSRTNAPLAASFGANLAAVRGVERVRASRVVTLPFRGQSIVAVATPLAMYRRRSPIDVADGGTYAEVTRRMQAGAVAVSENFAKRFEVGPGDRISLTTARGDREFEVAGVIVDYASEVGSIRFDRDVYARAWNDDRVDTYELDLQAGYDPHEVRREIDRRYGEQYGLFVVTRREQRAEIRRLAAQLFTLLRALNVVAIIVAVIGVANAQLANVLDRVREIGILRALGMRRRQVGMMVVAESALVSFVGVIAGIGAGAQGGQIILSHLNVLPSGWRFPYSFPVVEVLQAGVVMVVLSCLAALYPAVRAAQLAVTSALGNE